MNEAQIFQSEEFGSVRVLEREDGHELRAPLKRGAEQALREWVEWKAAEKKERHE